ncbi:addiction module protein [Desulforhabdus sp. TSK]|uniref:addiction module protein n=1 Tax=Desulforhabdus sp. TSK TaxID=2925014 RepID=UPI001FC7DB45|nr:addiction module protein [Desulforhabdus sp. TSK]GKT10533.1 hypothetical protein DSTSK_38380 [Desulforhabdus sp. TSK]
MGSEVDQTAYLLRSEANKERLLRAIENVEKKENMEAREILEQALKLTPQERFLVVEELLRSLDELDQELNALWIEEAEKRLRAYRDGRLKGIPMDSSEE